MKEVKTVIFDFNGTILDDLDLCFNILFNYVILFMKWGKSYGNI